MRVVDTSAWIEFLTASPTGRALAGDMPRREAWIVPTIVQLELAKWLGRTAEEDIADRIAAFTELCVVVPLDTQIAVAAATLYQRPLPTTLPLPSREGVGGRGRCQ